MLLADLKKFEANFRQYEEDTAEVIEYKAIRSTTVKGSFLQYDIIVPSHGSGGPLLLENLKRVNETLSPLVSAVNAFAGKFWLQIFCEIHEKLQISFTLLLNPLISLLLLLMIRVTIPDAARNWSISSASHIAVADINDIYVTMVR